MPEVNIDGLKELEKKLKDNATLNDVKKVVQFHGDKLNERMKAQTKLSFVKGYSVGDTASSINTELEDGGMTAVIEPKTEYAPYVEWGTRFMSAEPFVRPSYNVQKQRFIDDMKKLMR